MRRTRWVPGGQPVSARVGDGLALAVVAVVGLTACGGSSGTKKDGPATVTIKNFTFTPQPLKTTSGATVTVRNDDTTAHTFTADDHSFDTSNIDPGTSRTVKVAHGGSTAYHCNIHDYMKGTLTVG